MVLKRLLSFVQKSAIYGERTKEDITEVPAGFKLCEFEDENKQKHRYLYKAPQGGGSTNIFFGGSDLDLNSLSYKDYIKAMATKDPNAGIVVPIYPGYHDQKVKPSEKKITESCQKIVDRIRASEENSSINLVGYSMGAPIAAKIAADNPKNISNLTLIAPPSSIRDYSVEMASEMVPSLRKFFNLFSKCFGEKYSTVDALKRLNNKVKVQIITSYQDQFYQVRPEKGQSHYQEVIKVLGDRKAEYVTLEGVSHQSFLRQYEVREASVYLPEQNSRSNSSSIIDSSLTHALPDARQKVNGSSHVRS